MFNKGFTILELVVSIAIFALMTALLLAKYGTFNQGVILTNLAYDVALSIRNAQIYGLNVKSAQRGENNFSGTDGGAYGVHFDKNNNTKFIFFADFDVDGVYDQGEFLSETNIKGGSYIGTLCFYNYMASKCVGNYNTMDITFRRPDPNAYITYNSNPVGAADGRLGTEITLISKDGGSKKVVVNSMGQISVK